MNSKQVIIIVSFLQPARQLPRVILLVEDGDPTVPYTPELPHRPTPREVSRRHSELVLDGVDWLVSDGVEWAPEAAGTDPARAQVHMDMFADVVDSWRPVKDGP